MDGDPQTTFPGPLETTEMETPAVFGSRPTFQALVCGDCKRRQKELKCPEAVTSPCPAPAWAGLG